MNSELKSKEPLFLISKKNKEKTKCKMTIKLKKKKKMKRMLCSNNSLKIWKIKKMVMFTMKWWNKIKKKPTNHQNLITWLSVNQVVKSSSKFLLTWRNSSWLKLSKKFLRIPSWRKFKASDLLLFYNVKVVFHTFKPKVLTSTSYKNSHG